MTHVTAVLRQNAFRGRENSGNEATPTWIALANIDWSQEVDSSFRVRFVIQEIANATNPETVTPNLEFSLNGGAYTVIDGTTAVKYAAFVGATDDDATTQQLGAGTFVTGRLDSNGTVTTADLQNSETEYEYCITLDSALVAAGNTVALRVYNNVTAFDQYGQTPTLTAAAAVSERTGTHAADIAPIEGTGTGTAVGVVTGTHAADITAITGTGTAERVITGTDTSSITAITGTGTGALVVEVTGTGAIDSPVPTTAITAEREVTATGAIDATVPTSTGTAERVITGTDTSSITAITGAGTGAVSDLLYLRPDADNAIGSWQDQAAGTTNIYQSIDEEVANDTDYVRSETSPVDSVYKVRLSNPTGDGIDPDGLHDIVYRYGKGGDAEELNLIVRLVQGASTIIATWTHLDVAAGFTTATQSLSVGEVATITDYDDLFLEFEGDVAVTDAYIVNGFSPPLVADFANATPYYRKAGVDTTFADLFTFARASAATYIDSGGNLQTATSGTARTNAYYHNGATFVKGGLQLETEARTNLFLNNATLSTQNVTTTAASYTLHFTGTGTVTLTGTSTAGPLVGTGTGESDRVSLTFTPTAGTLTCTVSGTVSNAQIELGSTSSSVIPTTGSTVARAAETLTIAGADMPYATAFSFQMDGRVTPSSIGSQTFEVLAVSGQHEVQFNNVSSGTARQAIIENNDVSNLVATGIGNTVGPSYDFNIAVYADQDFQNIAFNGTSATADAVSSFAAFTGDFSPAILANGRFYGFVGKVVAWGVSIGDTGIEEAST